MWVIEGIERVDPPMDRSVLTIGNFDGVHRAHRRLLAEARRLSDELTDVPAVALTFEPHPVSVLRPEHAPPRLTDPAHKLELLAQAGADVVVVARADRTLLDMPPERFVSEVIIARFNPVHVVEGPSFRFGRDRRGTTAMLRETLAGGGCTVHELAPVEVEIGGEPVMVSSSLVRRLLADGRVRDAARALGRVYEIRGVVVAGAGRGRTIGFPTANIKLGEVLAPGDGVYAGSATIDDSGEERAAAVNVGDAPTFGDADRRVEVHIPDHDGSDLHGRIVRVRFFDRLRGVERFGSADELRDQLVRDVAAARRVFEEVRAKGCTAQACSPPPNRDRDCAESPT